MIIKKIKLPGMTLVQNLRTLLKPYYWLNILMSISYLLFKKTPYICEYFLTSADESSGCQLNARESEILLFLMIIVMIRSRKCGSLSMLGYLSTGFIYSKVANLILWFCADSRFGILYLILFILMAIYVPEPTYIGPSNVTYFRTALNLTDEIARDKSIVWLVCFYTAWNPTCTNFASVFAKLSADYALGNLKFGKIDVGRYPDAAKKFGINDAATSRQLPTLILFKNGEEVARKPAIESNGRILKFFFTEDNVKVSFDLNNLYKNCQNRLPKKSQKAQDKKTK